MVVQAVQVKRIMGMMVVAQRITMMFAATALVNRCRQIVLRYIGKRNCFFLASIKHENCNNSKEQNELSHRIAD